MNNKFVSLPFKESQHGDYGELLQQIVRWISTVGFDLETQSLALVFVTAIAISHKNLLTKGKINFLSWLNFAMMKIEMK